MYRKLTAVYLATVRSSVDATYMMCHTCTAWLICTGHFEDAAQARAVQVNSQDFLLIALPCKPPSTRGRRVARAYVHSHQ